MINLDFCSCADIDEYKSQKTKLFASAVMKRCTQLQQGRFQQQNVKANADL